MILHELFLAAGGDYSGGYSIYDIRHYYLHFSLFALIIGFVLTRVFPKAYSSWQKELKTQVERGEKERELAQELLAKAQGKIATIPQAVADLKERLSREAEAESNEIIQAAKKVAEDIDKRKEATIKAEKLAADASIKEELSKLALKEARVIIEKANLNDRKLRDEAFSGIGRLGMIQ